MTRMRIRAVLAVAFCAALVPGAVTSVRGGTSSSEATAQSKLKVPAWIVTGKQVTKERADVLSEALGTFDPGYQENGVIDYVDPDHFLSLPTEKLEQGEGKDEDGQELSFEAFDFDGISSIDVLPGEEAIELAEAALADALLDPLNGTRNVSRKPMASNSFFDVFADGQQTMHQAIDTHVDYELRLGRRGIPLLGPGADVKIAFDGEEHATRVHVALWSMRQGANVVIIPPSRAVKQAVASYKNQCGGRQLRGLKLASELVYYAPPLDLPAKKILPAYRIGGTALNGDASVQLREMFLPAVQIGAPKVSLFASAGGRSVNARAAVKGGTPPYQYAWESCTTPLDPANTGPAIQYVAGGRAPSSLETIIVHVTDANGLKASASKTVKLGSAAARRSAARRPAAIGRVDVGAETVGTSQGLPGCLPDTAGFVNRMALGGIPTQFHWTNNNAWEQDFKDPTIPGGADTSYADDVDATFYCGHANGDGFTFPTNHTDTFLHFSDARWGNSDLEWLGIAACGPLQDVSSGLQWWQRWGPAFRGLHLLAGYQTTSFDVTGEGFEWAHNMLGFFWWGAPLTVRQSWVSMAISQQPSSVQWAVMGAFGSGGVTNWNDYFWGKGPTGPDIVSPTGFWKVSGPA